MAKRIVFALLIGAIVWGCASQEKIDLEGKKVVFRGRWWSYYQRACMYIGQERYDEAEADLRKALGGRSRDSWQARTYGLHFVEYFPNRELGVVYYHLGRLDEAEEFLERAISGKMVDTDRAHHYLDLVARARIAKGDIEDTAVPTVAALVSASTAIEDVVTAEELPEPAPAPVVEDTVIVASPEVAVAIVASDDTGVSELSVNGEPVPQRGSQEELRPKPSKVRLSEGTHEIEIAAADLANKQTKQIVKVNIDLTGPNIGVFIPIDPTVTEDPTIPLEGTCVDKNGVVSVALGDRVLAESKGVKRLDFDSNLTLADGENSFLVIAKDIAGNRTQSVMKVFKGKPGSVAANLWLLEQRAPHLLKYASVHNPSMLPSLIANAESIIAAAEDPIAINLSSPPEDSDRPYPHDGTVRVSGSVVTNTKVASLTINGQAFDPLIGAPKESFSKSIAISDEVRPQDRASMAVAINAADDRGNEASRTLDVAIQRVLLDNSESKMPVAVLAFGAAGVDPKYGESLRFGTQGALYRDSDGRFRILDRANLAEVLTEQQLAAALADRDQAIRLGKLVNAQMFIVGDLIGRDDKGIEIKVQAINTETSDIMAMVDAYIDDKDDAGKVGAGCAKIASQLEDLFPRVLGKVLKVRASAGGAEMMLDWTEELGVRTGAYAIIFEHDEDWGDDTAVAKARVVKFIPGQGAVAKQLMDQQEEQDGEIREGLAAISM